MANKMKKELLITVNGYGFGHDWQMSVSKGKKTKLFYLGQDVKVCYRLIGMSPAQVAEMVGSNDLTKQKVREAICNLILKALGLEEEDEDQLFNLQAWEIAAE